MNKFCEFVDTGLDTYECIKCGLILQSEYGPPVFICPLIDLKNLPEKEQESCSIEQIERRYSICKTCEFFTNNTCTQCGCIITRNSEFKNKLLFKNSECPIKKWVSEY